MSDTSTTVTNPGNTGASPERTFTQAEMDAIIGDRLARERAKFADYDSLKDKAAKFDKAEEASKSELQKATEKAAALQKQLDALTKANDIRQVRDKVAKDLKVPAELLTGEDEPTCTAQAKAILAFAKQETPEVRDGGEVTTSGTRTTADQFAEWVDKAMQ